MPTLPLKDGTTTKDPRLDRLIQFDQRSYNYCVAATAPAKIVTKAWACQQWLDQGAEGACVGFGITHEAISTPVRVRGLDAKFARERIYWEAQKRDGWPGGSYPRAFPKYEGTSVLAGLKAYKATGLIDGYTWAFGLDQVLRGLSTGPCVLGVAWLDGMRKTDEEGYIHAMGKQLGRHCILATAVRVEDETVRFHNSWGKSWGVGGDCLFTWGDLGKLLDMQGEAAFVTGRHLKPKS